MDTNIMTESIILPPATDKDTNKDIDTETILPVTEICKDKEPDSELKLCRGFLAYEEKLSVCDPVNIITKKDIIMTLGYGFLLGAMTTIGLYLVYKFTKN